ncbi:unnamed protein product, partial [Brassica napus]
SPSVILILLHICNNVSISFDAIMMEMGMISLKQMDRVCSSNPPLTWPKEDNATPMQGKDLNRFQ